MNKENLKYLHCDVFQVETDKDGKKRVHIDGYCYENENGYQLVQGTFCYIEVEEIMATSDSDKLDALIDREFSEVNQYQCDMTEEEVCDYYNNIPELHYSKVSLETPDGTYISY